MNNKKALIFRAFVFEVEFNFDLWVAFSRKSNQKAFIGLRGNANKIHTNSVGIDVPLQKKSN